MSPFSKFSVFCAVLAVLFFCDTAIFPLSMQINKNQMPPADIIRLINNGGLLVTDSNNKIIYSYNETRQFVPASILKILSSYFALKTLGQNFRFRTDVFFDALTNDIYIKGYGDPLFISEQMHKLAKEISAKHRSINNIYVDDSFFDELITIPGISATLNPYDTQNGALTVNFNTVAVKFENGDYYSAEPQTPMTDFIKSYLKSINFRGGDRVNIGKNRDYSELYFGELLKEFLNIDGLKIAGSVQKKTVLSNLNPSIIFLSDEPLEELIRKINRYSNNFMINQIFLYIGALKNQPPASLDKSVDYFNFFAANDKTLKNIVIKEAAGLSRDNKISCVQANYVLKLFEPYKHLLTERAGGLFKTGTLSGVYSVSGYYNSKKYGEVYITIIVNQPQNTRNLILEKLIKLLD